MCERKKLNLVVCLIHNEKKISYKGTQLINNIIMFYQVYDSF